MYNNWSKGKWNSLRLSILIFAILSILQQVRQSLLSRIADLNENGETSISDYLDHIFLELGFVTTVLID